jgi:hypothetical protein
MNDAARSKQIAAGWGSDAIADLLRALEFPYIALTPGASFRGLHDSLVNYLGNTRPEILLCVHEEARWRSPMAMRASPGSRCPSRCMRDVEADARRWQSSTRGATGSRCCSWAASADR